MSHLPTVISGIDISSILEQQRNNLNQTQIRKSKSKNWIADPKRTITSYNKLKQKPTQKRKRKRTSLWPLAAAKWRGELRPPKVEYLARQGLQSKSIFASIKSPSLAAETSRSPEAEHPNELPIFPSHHPLSLSL